MKYLVKCLTFLACFLLLGFNFSCAICQETNAVKDTVVDLNGKLIKTKVPFPANLTECIEELKRRLPTKGDVLDDFKSNPAEVALDYHLTLGMWIRNEWIRHGDGRLIDYFNKLGIYGFDDMSGIILDSLWRDLHSVPIDLSGQIAMYKYCNFYNAQEVREKRSMASDVWREQLLLQNGSVKQLSDFKGKPIILLLVADDIVSPLALSELATIKDTFSKSDLVIVALGEPGDLPHEDKQYSKKNNSVGLPILPVKHDCILRIQEALISPGSLGYPQTILIGRDGNMIIRFNDWHSDTSKTLCNEIENALNILPQSQKARVEIKQ